MKNKRLWSNVYGSIEDNDLFIDETDFPFFEFDDDEMEDDEMYFLFNEESLKE